MKLEKVEGRIKKSKGRLRNSRDEMTNKLGCERIKWDVEAKGTKKENRLKLKVRKTEMRTNIAVFCHYVVNAKTYRVVQKSDMPVLIFMLHKFLVLALKKIVKIGVHLPKLSQN